MGRSKYSAWLTGFGGLMSMLVGGILMIVLVVLFHQETAKEDTGAKRSSSIIKMTRKPKPVVKKAAPQKAPRPRKVATNKVSPPDLSGMIGNLELSTPEFAPRNDIPENDPTELLEDVVNDSVMNTATVDVQPRVQNRAPMQYPAEAAREGVTGFVLVKILIAGDGRVELAEVLKSEPEGVFESTVLRSIRGWTFAPATYAGKPVKVWAEQRISFSG
jgi:protein TonB